jgi:hypothetical protein
MSELPEEVIVRIVQPFGSIRLIVEAGKRSIEVDAGTDANAVDAATCAVLRALGYEIEKGGTYVDMGLTVIRFRRPDEDHADDVRVQREQWNTILQPRTGKG